MTPTSSVEIAPVSTPGIVAHADRTYRTHGPLAARTVRRRWLAPACCAVVLVGAPVADAATVSVRTATAEVVLVAAPGEVNDVETRETLDSTSSRTVVQVWTISDAGSVLVPGESCMAVGPHVVRCAPPAGFDQLLAVRIELGDMEDRLVAVDAGGTSYVRADGGPGHDRLLGANFVNGGPGDDELVASAFGFFGNFGDVLDGGPGNDRVVGGAGSDELHGGGGVDDLNGGGNTDRLFDDDLDSAIGASGPGPDRLDGGPDVDGVPDQDVVSYERRITSVHADLSEGTSEEGDRLINIEALIGGRGNDTLVGDDGPNMLDGAHGQDRLSGRGGADELLRAEGPVSCGAQIDTYYGGRRSRDLLQPDCEILAPEFGADISANPVAVFRQSVRFRIQCPPDYDDDAQPPYRRTCGPGPLRLREAQGRRRTLARGHLPVGEWSRRFVNVRLTPVGRRLASRRHGVWARVRLAGYYPDGPALRWTIRLKVRRLT